MAKSFQLFFVKRSILDIWQCSQYASVICYSLFGKIEVANRICGLICWGKQQSQQISIFQQKRVYGKEKKQLSVKQHGPRSWCELFVTLAVILTWERLNHFLSGIKWSLKIQKRCFCSSFHVFSWSILMVILSMKKNYQSGLSFVEIFHGLFIQFNE